MTYDDFARPRGDVRDPVNLTATNPDPEAIQEDMDLVSAADELWGAVGTLSMLEIIHIDDEEALVHLRTAKRHLRAYLLPAAELAQEPEPWESEADLERRRALLDRDVSGSENVAAEQSWQEEQRAARVAARKKMREEAPAAVAAELENTVAYPDEVTSSITSSDLPEPDPDALQRELDAHDARVEGR